MLTVTLPSFAEQVVFSETEVNLQDAIEGGCGAVPSVAGYALPNDMLRAELGVPFTLSADDFPLVLTVPSANASGRGADAATTAKPAVYFSFWTDELDLPARSVTARDCP